MNAKSIELVHYKRLLPAETSLLIQKGVNLLVGQNGSGKSSLLEYLFNKPNRDYTCVAYSSGLNRPLA